jgi:hypothetical protein
VVDLSTFDSDAQTFSLDPLKQLLNDIQEAVSEGTGLFIQVKVFSNKYRDQNCKTFTTVPLN